MDDPFDSPVIGILFGPEPSPPAVVVSLTRALDHHNGDPEAAAGHPGLLQHWTETAPEDRAGLLLNASWWARTGNLEPTDDTAGLCADTLHTWANEFTGIITEFLGPNFPTMPLPGASGKFAASLAFDRDEPDVSLSCMLQLLALVRRMLQDPDTA